MINVRRVLGSLVLVGLATAGTGAGAQQAPIVQPGAPGQPTQALTPQQAIQIADTRFSPDDVRFMQDMILHHRQAVEMAALVRDRTNRQPLVDAARRIDASQADEIAFMSKWLRDRSQVAPDPAAMHAMHAMPAMAPMSGMTGNYAAMGMATPEQMAAMAAARGPAFDRLFLERMITHHQGAVTMAEGLLKRGGSAADPVLFEFVNGVINEQKAEIRRMTALLVGLVDDPRSGLKPGFNDAGQAISGMRLVASLPKPTGFFDPANPAGLPLPKPIDPKKPAPEKKPGKEDDERFPLLSFANTDMAFSDDLLAVGNYHGFNLYRLAEGGKPQLISSVICPGGQGDLSIVGNLLIMSVEQNRGRVDCGRQGISTDVSPERFRGIRIFNIADRVAADPGRTGADLPGLAHPLGGFRAGEGRQDHRICLGHVPGPQGRRARGLRRRGGRSRHRSVPHRRGRNPRRQPVAGPDHRPASGVRRSQDRQPRRPVARRRARRRHTGDEPHRPVPRHHRLPQPVARRRRLLGERHHLRHRRSAKAAPDRRRFRPHLLLLAFGDVQQ